MWTTSVTRVPIDLDPPVTGLMGSSRITIGPHRLITPIVDKLDIAIDPDPPVTPMTDDPLGPIDPHPTIAQFLDKVGKAINPGPPTA